MNYLYEIRDLDGNLVVEERLTSAHAYDLMVDHAEERGCDLEDIAVRLAKVPATDHELWMAQEAHYEYWGV